VGALLRAGAGANSASTAEGSTPLHRACDGGHARVIATLLAAGAQLELAKRDGSVPLHVAAGSGQLEAARALLRARADPAACRLSDGKSPLMLAAANGHDLLLRLLVLHGAPLNAQSKKGGCALGFASGNGQLDTARTRREAGAVPLAAADGSTPLRLAAAAGHGAVVALLEEHDRPNLASGRSSGASLEPPASPGEPWPVPPTRSRQCP
jgi:ankyrin repeat protein